MEAETATGLGRAGRGWARLGEAGRGWDEDQDPRLEVAGGGWRLVTGPRLTSRGAGRRCGLAQCRMVSVISANHSQPMTGLIQANLTRHRGRIKNIVSRYIYLNAYKTGRRSDCEEVKTFYLQIFLKK